MFGCSMGENKSRLEGPLSARSRRSVRQSHPLGSLIVQMFVPLPRDDLKSAGITTFFLDADQTTGIRYTVAARGDGRLGNRKS